MSILNIHSRSLLTRYLHRNSGVALISVLWLIILLSTVASGLTYSSRNAANNLASQRGSTEARYLSEGAIQLIYLNLLSPRIEQRLLADGEEIAVNLNSSEVVVTLSDEHGKVDINSASELLLARLFKSIGVPEEDSISIAAAIADYRDQDDLRRLNGAEGQDYLSAGLTYEPKNELFSALDELNKVLGMTSDIYDRVEPYITIYTSHRGVNPEVSPLPVLMAASDDSMLTLENYIDDRRHAHSLGLPMPPPPVIDRQFLSRIRGVIYSISASGLATETYRSGLTSVIRLRRSRAQATIETLAWKPFIPADQETDHISDDPPRKEK